VFSINAKYRKKRENISLENKQMLLFLQHTAGRPYNSLMTVQVILKMKEATEK